jgi:Ser/Thr protein kinase RdoA (MazF antagonist)
LECQFVGAKSSIKKFRKRELVAKDFQQDLYDITKEFQVSGQITSVLPYGNGHINKTYLVNTLNNMGETGYVFQRINHHVFHDPEVLMENFLNITAHLVKKYHEAGVRDINRRVLQPVSARNGACKVYDSQGYLWRATTFIKNTITYQIVNSASQAFEVGRSYGQFQQLMLDFPANLIHETIHDFHNTRFRFDCLQGAIQEDKIGRAANARNEINFINSHENWVDFLLDFLKFGQLPTRIIHNDTKVNNLLVDKGTLEGLCVTDLDTTMPGTSLYDFGDMVRTSTNTAPEDEVDVTKVNIDLNLFKALVTGYLNASQDFLTEIERRYLVFSGKVITFELAVRFLTDYLEGDRYFKIDYPDHNLVRCHSQLALVKAIDKVEDEMENIVDLVWQGRGDPLIL